VIQDSARILCVEPAWSWIVRFILLIFVLTPIIEMWLLIKVGGVIGALPTIALVLLTAMLGLALLRQQSFSTLMRARARMDGGELPAKEMIEGIFLAVGGALLLTPGFLTDAIGFACLLPGIRQILIAWGMRHFTLRNATFQGGFSSSSSRPEAPKDTIEGEFRRDD